MKAKSLPRRTIVPLVICLTAAHVAVRLSAQREPEPRIVSSLEAGESVTLPMLAPAASLTDPGECLQVVAFNPDCPFCNEAAEREREALSPEGRARRIWVTDAERNTLSDFVQEHLDVEPLISAELFTTLHVHAVPALFVLGSAGEIRWVGPYQGDETDALLAERCTG